MFELLVKALVGAVMVVVIQLLARTERYYIAGLAPLFPTFALISHYIVGSEKTSDELKSTIVFSMFSLLPYLCYLLVLYFLVDRCRLVVSLLGGTLAWFVAAVGLILVWNRM